METDIPPNITSQGLNSSGAPGPQADEAAQSN